MGAVGVDVFRRQLDAPARHQERARHPGRRQPQQTLARFERFADQRRMGGVSFARLFRLGWGAFSWPCSQDSQGKRARRWESRSGKQTAGARIRGVIVAGRTGSGKENTPVMLGGLADFCWKRWRHLTGTAPRSGKVAVRRRFEREQPSCRRNETRPASPLSLTASRLRGSRVLPHVSPSRLGRLSMAESGPEVRRLARHVEPTLVILTPFTPRRERLTDVCQTALWKCPTCA